MEGRGHDRVRNKWKTFKGIKPTLSVAVQLLRMRRKLSPFTSPILPTDRILTPPASILGTCSVFIYSLSISLPGGH